MTTHGLQGRRVTVAGASGFIGTHLVPALVSRGAIVRAVVHANPPRFPQDGVEVVQEDLTTVSGCRLAMQNTEIFVMAAANSSGAQVMADKPLTHLTPNVVMNALTLEAAHALGVSKYCFISSNTVYPPGENPMSETDASGKFFPAYDVVADMKLFSERMAGFYQFKVPNPMGILIVRPANLYGPFDKFSPNESKVIPALIRRAVNREDPFVVWGDGRDVKDFLYISDFVEGLMAALELDSAYEVFNLASGESVSLQEIIPIILSKSGGKPVTVTFDESKPSMIPVRRISNDKARSDLRWRPVVSMTEGIERTVDWYRRSGGLPG